MKKDNISDLLSNADQKLLKSVKNEFSKLSKVDQKKIIDSTNSIMDSFCDVLGIENKYKLTEDMLTNCKDKCKDIKKEIKDNLNEKKDNLTNLAKDTLSKLGISDEFIKNYKIKGDKIYIDVQMPIDDKVSNIDLNIDDADGVGYSPDVYNINQKFDDDHENSVKHCDGDCEGCSGCDSDYIQEQRDKANEYSRKNKVKNKKSRKIKFKNTLNKQQVKHVVEQEQVKQSVLDRLKSEVIPAADKVKIDEDEIVKDLVDKVSAILEDDETHAYVVYPRDGSIPPSVQVQLDDVCSDVLDNCNILNNVVEQLKEKYDFPDVYIHASNETNEDVAKVIVVMTLEN